MDSMEREAQPALTVEMVKQRKSEVEQMIMAALAAFEHENNVTVSDVGMSNIKPVGSSSLVGTFQITVTI